MNGRDLVAQMKAESICPKCGGRLKEIGQKEGFSHTSPNWFGGTVINTRTIYTRQCTNCGYIIEM